MGHQEAAQLADAVRPIRSLARWTLDDHPAYGDPIVRRQAKLLILDSVSCAIAALDVPTPRRVLEVVAELGGTPDCTIIGVAAKTSLLNAVLANGALVRSLDFNDVQFFIKEGRLSVAGHCSDNIPVALAVGERVGTSGTDILRALVMGYELFRRLRDLMPFSSAWDGTSVSGLVAAAMAGRLMGLDEERQAQALALAAARCATPSVVRWGRLSGAKNLANALVAQSGALAALLAAKGVTGPLEVLDHPGGLHQLFDPALGLDRLWQPAAVPLYIMTSSIKPYACIGTAQTAVAAALEMHADLAGRIGRVARIEVTMADLPMIRRQQGEAERRRPRTREAADHSFTFLPAVAMVDGDMTDSQFAGDRWNDPAIRDLIAKTELGVDGGLAARAPDSMPSRISVHLDTGEVLERECLYHPGYSSPERGLDGAVVEAKFHEVAKGAFGEEERHAIVGGVMAMEERGLADLMDLLARRGRAR